MTQSAFSTLCNDAIFKTCNYCGQHWSTLDAFVQDPNVDLAGYMPTFDDLSDGLFLFNHGCGTTLACKVAQFAHLYVGPTYLEIKTGENECPGYCQNKFDFSPCPEKCNCAYVREILLILKQWPKSKAA